MHIVTKAPEESQMDRPTAAQEIRSGQAAVRSQGIWWDPLLCSSCNGVSRKLVSCQRAWLGLSSKQAHSPQQWGYQYWREGADGDMALQGLLWLPEAVSNQDQGVGSTRQAQEGYSILSVPGGPGRLENGLFLSATRGLLGKIGWQGLQHLLAPICGFTTAIESESFLF